MSPGTGQGGGAGTPDASRFRPVQDRVAGHPEGDPALLWAGGTVTFGELNAEANRWARLLRQRLPGRGRLVALSLERTPELVAALLGVLRAGHAFLPLDPAQPRELSLARLRQAGADLWVAADPEGGEADPSGPDRLGLDRASEALALLAPEDPGSGIEAADLAYCLFTSGSTGRPKCVELAHGGLAAYPEAFNARLGLRRGERYLHTAQFSFSASVRQLFVPLASGATVLLASRDQVRDPLGLLAWATAEAVTVVDWVPSYLRQVCALLEGMEVEARRALLARPPAVLVASGEPLPWSLVRRWRALAGSEGRIVSAYGQTETTGLIAWHEVGTGEERGRDGLVPLGTALPPAVLLCLDDRRRMAGPGERGELWAGGPCVARGYRNAEAALERAPHPDPSGPDLYRTGDHARVAQDGTLVFEGRRDDLVKVRGVRLALGEVEEALRGHPAVQDAAVLALADGAGEVRLHAFLEARPGDRPDDPALRRHLRERHPEPFLPHVLAWLPRLPRTASGKIDRPALAPGPLEPRGGPEQGSGKDPEPGLGPEAVEAAVRAAWTATLGPEAEDGDFFEWGGDSLQAVAMLGRLAATLGLRTPLVASFFGDPTLEGLLRAVQAGLAAPPEPALRRRPRPGDPGSAAP